MGNGCGHSKAMGRKVTARLLSLFLFLSVLSLGSVAYSQEPNTQLSVPLLEGSPAPFSGLLLTETHATQCIEDAAAAARLGIEVSVRQRQLTISSQLYESFIEEQKNRISELLQTSWWDRNGSLFMLGVGIVFGLVGSAVVVGLANN